MLEFKMVAVTEEKTPYGWGERPKSLLLDLNQAAPDPDGFSETFSVEFTTLICGFFQLNLLNFISKVFSISSLFSVYTIGDKIWF